MSPDSSADYVSRLHKGQAACLNRLQTLADSGGSSGEEGTLDISPVPYFDMEVAGVYPLRCWYSCVSCIDGGVELVSLHPDVALFLSCPSARSLCVVRLTRTASRLRIALVGGSLLR